MASAPKFYADEVKKLEQETAGHMSNTRVILKISNIRSHPKYTNSFSKMIDSLPSEVVKKPIGHSSIFGRAENVDVYLHDILSSRKHVKLDVVKDYWGFRVEVMNISATKVIELNGTRKVRPNETITLENNDQLTIGCFTFLMKIVQGDPRSTQYELEFINIYNTRSHISHQTEDKPVVFARQNSPSPQVNPQYTYIQFATDPDMYPMYPMQMGGQHWYKPEYMSSEGQAVHAKQNSPQVNRQYSFSQQHAHPDMYPMQMGGQHWYKPEYMSPERQALYAQQNSPQVYRQYSFSRQHAHPDMYPMQMGQQYLHWPVSTIMSSEDQAVDAKQTGLGLKDKGSTLGAAESSCTSDEGLGLQYKGSTFGVTESSCSVDEGLGLKYKGSTLDFAEPLCSSDEEFEMERRRVERVSGPEDFARREKQFQLAASSKLDQSLGKLDFSELRIESNQLTANFSSCGASSLDFSMNHIDRIPEEFLPALKNIKELSFAFNQIKDLPANFGKYLNTLESLHLEDNRFAKLPSDFGNWFPNLQSLYLQKNNLTSLPEDFGTCLTGLFRLSLYGNKLSKLPCNFGKGFSELRYLDLNQNELKSLPKDFGENLKDLEYLNLYGNDLNELPDDFGKGFPRLQKLYLKQNELKSLPENFGESLENLEYLYLHRNNLNELPGDFGKYFSKLTWLKLNNNELTSLPEDFGEGLENLKHLDLSSNELNELPCNFGKCFTSLKFLHLNQNKLKSLPKDFGERLENLQHLHLDGNELVELPRDFGQWFSRLQKLNLKQNELKSLPENFGESLENLQNLYLDRNELNELPRDFGKWFLKLELLHLDYNKLTSLPKDFGECLKNLKYLKLDGNELVELPLKFGGKWFPRLQQLYLKQNKLKSLPESFGESLENLQYLYLHRNKLNELPRDFEKWFSKLEWLNLDYNELTSLPEGLGAHFKHLIQLSVLGNPLAELPSDFSNLMEKVVLDPAVRQRLEIEKGRSTEAKKHGEEKSTGVSGISEKLRVEKKVSTNSEKIYATACPEVPEDDALSGAVKFQLSETAIEEANIDFVLGESCLSDVVFLEPEDTKLLKPCQLVIPYNLHEQPTMTEVVLKHFVSSKKKWVDLQTSIVSGQSGDGKCIKKLATAEIEETGLYVVCLVLKSIQFEIDFDEKPIELYPFGEDIGIKLRFESGTFESYPETCTVKVNIFTNDANDALRNIGITTSPIVHIETTSGLLKKPVQIKLPFQQVDGDQGNIRLIQGNDNKFEDITDTSSYELQDGYVIFYVQHFSFFMSVRSKVSEFLEILKTYVSGALDAAFYLYGIQSEKDLSCQVACSLVEDNEKVNEWFKETDYTLIDKCLSKKGLYCGTSLKFDVFGKMKINCDVELLFSFSQQKYRTTKTFKLEEKDERDENNTDYINIVGRDDGVEYAQIAYWRLLQDRNTGVCQRAPFVINIKNEYHEHRLEQHEHKHENKFEKTFNIDVKDNATAIVGETKTGPVHAEVLQIANYGAQGADNEGRELEMKAEQIFEIEDKKE